MNTFVTRATVFALCLAIVSLGSPVVAHAGIISTLTAVESAGRSESLARINSALSRDEVRAGLSGMGLEPAVVEARLAALTDSELASMAGQIDAMPAGGDALAVLGIVFLVLLVLEAVGVINIFTKFP